MFLHIVMSVTQLKKIWQQMKDSTQELNDACDRMQDAITNLKREKEIRYTIPTISRITGRSLQTVIKNKFPKTQLWTLDRYYYIPTVYEQLIQCISEDQTDKVEYKTDRTDCDDFSMAFKGLMSIRHKVNSVGFVASPKGRHAFNLLVVRPVYDYELYVYEPQTDQILKNPETKKQYNMDGAIIMI